MLTLTYSRIWLMIHVHIWTYSSIMSFMLFYVEWSNYYHAKYSCISSQANDTHQQKMHSHIWLINLHLLLWLSFFTRLSMFRYIAMCLPKANTNLRNCLHYERPSSTNQHRTEFMSTCIINVYAMAAFLRHIHNKI